MRRSFVCSSILRYYQMLHLQICALSIKFNDVVIRDNSLSLSVVLLKGYVTFLVYSQ